MKKTKLFLAIATLSIMAIFTTTFASDINVRLNNYKPFKFVLDNESYRNGTSYWIKNIIHGYHTVSAYETKNGNNYHKLIFTGRVFIPANKSIDVVISKNWGFKITRETPIGGYHGEGNGNNHGNDHGNNHYNDNDYDYNTGNNYYGNNGYYNNYSAMGDYEFSMLLSTIRNTSFDSSKMDIAKTALLNNRLFSRQVYELIKLYSFDSSRLEIAKYAYSKTVDKGNYFLVNNAFTFSSSADDLNRFIRNGGY